MTKKELINQIQAILPGEDETGKYHPNVVAAALERAMNQIFYSMAVKSERELDDYATSYGSPTPLTVSQDTNTLIYYTSLPNQFVPMPGKRSGVMNVYTAEQGEVAFSPMTKKEADLAPNTLTGLIGGRIGYIPRGDRVEYYNMNATVAAAGVRMDIIVPFTDLALTDEVKYPYGYDLEITKATLEILGVIQPVDLKDNNSDG